MYLANYSCRGLIQLNKYVNLESSVWQKGAGGIDVRCKRSSNHEGLSLSGVYCPMAKQNKCRPFFDGQNLRANE